MKRSNQKLSSATQPLIQELESRTMFSVVTVGHWGDSLNISGSGSNDTLAATLTPTDTGADVRLVNGGNQRQAKVYHDVKYVYISTNGGADKVTISGIGFGDSDQDQNVYVSVWLGNGDDVLMVKDFDGNMGGQGGNGNDTLNASKAIDDDAILGWSSYISLDGGAGNDTLTGSANRDGLSGGDGNDLINAGDGDDYINGGAGTNVLNGQDGDDTFNVYPLQGLVVDGNLYGTGGTDIINGGDGDDTVYQNYNSKSGAQTFSTKSINTELSQSFDYALIIGGGKG